jgi:PhzF family phenazine biosynthesis protein
MIIALYQVDAFTKRLFHGNPAGVCILEEWIDKGLMQQIALENNLSETAFAVKKDHVYHIRWFTPATEVNLCGHATLATAHVLFHHYRIPGTVIRFHSRYSGLLMVRKEKEALTLDFPADPVKKATSPKGLIRSLGKTPREIWKGKTDYLLVYDSEKDVKSIQPDFFQLTQVNARGIIITAPGDQCDFVSRFFAPQVGVDEDPVTGSAHTTLTPFWTGRLNKKRLTAKQLSKRQGNLCCRMDHDRVLISGNAITYMQGIIVFPD